LDFGKIKSLHPKIIQSPMAVFYQKVRHPSQLQVQGRRGVAGGN